MDGCARRTRRDEDGRNPESRKCFKQSVVNVFKSRMRGLDLNQRRRPLLFLAGHATYIGLVFIFPFAMTYAMPKSEFSRYTVYINWMNILVDGGTLGLGRALQQLAIQTPEEELRSRLRLPLQGALAALLALLGAMTAGFALAGTWRMDWFEGQPAIAFWLWMASALGLARLCFSFLLYGIRRFKWYIGIDVAWAVARLLVIPAGWRMAGVAGTLAGNALLYAAGLAVSIAVVAHSGVRPAWGPLREAWRAIKYFLKLGFWMHVIWIAPSLARPAAVLLLAWMLGRESAAVGMAHLSISLLAVAALLLESLFLSLYPEKARAGVEGRKGELAAWANEEARALGFLLWPLMVAAAWLAWIPVRLLPAEYHDLALWLGPVALALPARAMAAPLITALQAGHRPAVGAFYQGLRLVLDLFGIMIAMILWRGPGAPAAWGILAGEWAATAALFVIQRRREGRARGEGWRKALIHPETVKAWGLIAIMAGWAAALEWMAGGGFAEAGLDWRNWAAWLAMTAVWAAALPQLGLTRWRNVRMTFTPQREQT